MKLGLNLAVYNDRSIESALALAASQGVETVEINVDSIDPRTPHRKINSPLAIASLRKALNANGLRVSAIGNHADSQLIGGPFHTDTDHICPGTREEKQQHGISSLRATAQIAAELEVDTVIGFTGCEDWTRWFPWPDKEGWDKMLPMFVDTWMPLLDELKSLSIRFAHEVHPKQLAYDLETAERVTSALEHHSHWGFNLDLANLSLAGVEPAAFVQALGERVFHVHAKDLEFVSHNLARSGWQAHGNWERPDRGVRFRVPGWGDVNFKRTLSQLQLAGYTGSVSIEHEDPVFSREEGITKAIDYLRPLIIRQTPETRWW